MNLLGTLAKVAIGTMVARGVGKMISGNRDASGSGAMGAGAGGLGGALGGLGGLLGGSAGQSQSGQASGGLGSLGGLLGGLMNGGSQQQGIGGTATSGGLGGLLGGVLSGAGSQAGGLGGLLGSLGGAGQSQGGGIGDMLNQALGGQTTPEPTPEQNSQAEIMLRAMINAAKSDGEIDADEKQKILGQLADAGDEEKAFVRNELNKSLDVEGFIGSVPQGLEQQVYLMSLLAIDLDSDAEAQYLDRLAKGMNVSQSVVNQIHAKVGVPPLYS